MSRRSIFLLAAMVMIFYFSIILFMLNPLHGAKSSYYGSSKFAFRSHPSVSWCKELSWRSAASPAVALVSYPGSGNTWLRYLLQQITGLLTGSIYMDYGLKAHGFPAENITDGSVLVVKTHEPPPADANKFKAAVLLIRNPRDAILADFNRLHKGHVGTAPKSAFHRKSNEYRRTDWSNYVMSQLMVWESLHQAWLTRFQGPIHIVFYEVLVHDTKDTLSGIIGFLNQTASQEDMACTMLHKEGIYRRKKKLEDFDPFTAEMYRDIEIVKHRLLNIINDYRRRHNVTERIF